METVKVPNEKSTEPSRKAGASVIDVSDRPYKSTVPSLNPNSERRRQEQEPTVSSLFHRDENGDLQFNDSIFADYDFTNDEEMAIHDQEMEASIWDAFGDLDSLDIRSITIEQVRQAFGGIKENFSLQDVIDATCILASFISYNDNDESFNIY